MLYRFRDAAGELLYVGITTRGPDRWADHERSRDWWERVRSASVEMYPDRQTAEVAERLAIEGEAPLFNRMYALGIVPLLAPIARSRIPVCHPERAYHALDLCRLCYQSYWRKLTRQREERRARLVADLDAAALQIRRLA